MQQTRQPGLRMGIDQSGPDFLGRVGIQAGQHHRARGQPGDHTEQTCHRRNATGGAGDQHAILRRLPLPGRRLGIQQRHLACCRVHQALLGQPVRPGAGHDMQEFQRPCPMRRIGRIGGVRQPLGEVDLRPLRLVHQRGQFRGKAPGTVGGARRTVSTLHRQDQPGQRRQPLRRLHRRRQIERASQRQRCLVQRAKCSDARQQQRPAAGRAQKRLGQRARGAARRQQDYATRHLQRIASAAQPLLCQRIEERDAGRDGEEVQRVSPVSCARRIFSASARSAGVERWNHRPSCITARSRPFCIAVFQA